MYDFIGIGEMLIDFTPIPVKESETPVFQANPGGAPANVACVMAKLGLQSAFIGKVGRGQLRPSLQKSAGRCRVRQPSFGAV